MSWWLRVSIREGALQQKALASSTQADLVRDEGQGKEMGNASTELMGGHGVCECQP
jgi:hypothetical protein